MALGSTHSPTEMSNWKCFLVVRPPVHTDGKPYHLNVPTVSNLGAVFLYLYTKTLGCFIIAGDIKLPLKYLYVMV
jgi:hypothetical protein